MTSTWDEVETAPDTTVVSRRSWRANIRAAWAQLPLRLMWGFGFMYHGYPKVFDAAQRAGFTEMLSGLGVPWPSAMAWIVGSIEFFGGALLILGALVPLVALLGIVEMVVAMMLVHLPAGFNFMNQVGTTPGGEPQFGLPGYEVNLLYIAGFIALAIGGAGPLSMDRAASGTGRRADRSVR